MSHLHEQVTWPKVKRLQAILDALVSDDPDSKFDAEIVEWRKRVVATVKRNLAPSAQKRVNCACTEFDDGSKFEMTSFAGGGAKEGAFSIVGCTETKPDGTTVHHRYQKAEAGAREKLDQILHVLSHAGRCDSKTSVLEDADGDPVQAIAFLDTALDAARQAEWKCCTRNAWGDGEHDVTCPYAKAQAKIAELERRLKLVGYYGDDARRAEFAEVERRIEEVEARAAGYAQRICNARRELDRTFTPPHGDGG